MTGRPLSSVANELLVLRCQGGDERALAVLFEHWNPRFARHAARMTGRADAVPDVCQEAWLAIVRGLARLDDPARFPAWAYRIVSRRCMDWIRQRRAGQNTAPLAEEPAASGSDRAGDDEIQRLRHAFRQLSTDHQAVLGLFYSEGLGVRRIAEVLDIPTGSVQSRLHHGRRTLAQVLERRDP